MKANLKDLPLSFDKLILAEKLKICLLVFTFIRIFLVDINLAIIPMEVDLNPSLRCSIEVNAYFLLCNH